MAKETFVVVCSSLYLRVNGELQEMPVGAHIELDADQVENGSLKGKVKPASEVRRIEVGQAEAEYAAAKAKLESIGGTTDTSADAQSSDADADANADADADDKAATPKAPAGKKATPKA